MNRDLLEKPFDKSLVKSRKGAFGRVQYVEASEYIRRLNQAFEADWSFEIVDRQILEAEVLVHGKLTAAGIVKHAFGGSSITRAKENGEIVSVVDDLKAAATDSLKKCCSLFGIGLHLYSNNHHAESARNSTHNRSTPRRTQPRPGNGGNGRDRGAGGDRNASGNNDDRLTQKQLSAIWAIGRKLSLGADEIRKRAVQTFGAAPEFLGKADASAFITELGEELGGSQ